MQISKGLKEMVCDAISLHEMYKRMTKKVIEAIEETQEIDTDGLDFESMKIVDKPRGEAQGDGEYCEQFCLGEDWYRGTYFIKIENEDKWLAIGFEV